MPEHVLQGATCSCAGTRASHAIRSAMRMGLRLCCIAEASFLALAKLSLHTPARRCVAGCGFQWRYAPGRCQQMPGLGRSRHAASRTIHLGVLTGVGDQTKPLAGEGFHLRIGVGIGAHVAPADPAPRPPLRLQPLSRSWLRRVQQPAAT